MAGCSTFTYYHAYKKPYFADILKAVAKDLVKQAVLPTIHAFAKEAARGSFQHGEVILEMADLYVKKSKMEHSGPNGGPIETASLTPEQRRKRIKELMAKQKGKPC